MKKGLLVGIGVVLALGVFVILVGMYRFNFTNNDVYVETETGEVVPYDERKESIAALALLKNAEIVAPDSDERVQLTDGRGSYEIIPGGASQGDVTLHDDVFAQWSDEGRVDLVTVFTVNSGGSGTFYYLVLFDVTGDTFTKKSEVFLGDRIRVTHVGIGELVHDPDANYRVGVQTLERGTGEPFIVEPSVQRARLFYVTDQVLEEVEVIRGDT